MKRFANVRRVRHDAHDMFDLVADIGRYPEFVPYCERLVVRNRTAQPDGREAVVASMTLGYRMFNETFGCRVLKDEAKLVIVVEYLDGPFRYLNNRWTFRPLEMGSEVDFYIEYELRSRSLSLIVGSVFDRAFEKLSEAFERRADAIYGVKTQ